jgi:DNA-binding response OmpR family regulator
MDAGADGFVEKPLDFDAVLARVKERMPAG